MKKAGILLLFLLSACIYTPIPKDYPNQNLIGFYLTQEEFSTDASFSSPPPKKHKRLYKVYQLISEAMQSASAGKPRYKALEKLGMYCMYFNNNSEVECRYKVYTLTGPLKEAFLDTDLHPLLSLSIFPDIGIKSFKADVKIIKARDFIGDIHGKEYDITKRKFLLSVMKEDIKSRIYYE